MTGRGRARPSRGEEPPALPASSGPVRPQNAGVGTRTGTGGSQARPGTPGRGVPQGGRRTEGRSARPGTGRGFTRRPSRLRANGPVPTHSPGTAGQFCPCDVVDTLRSEGRSPGGKGHSARGPARRRGHERRGQGRLRLVPGSSARTGLSRGNRPEGDAGSRTREAEGPGERGCSSRRGPLGDRAEPRRPGGGAEGAGRRSAVRCPTGEGAARGDGGDPAAAGRGREVEASGAPSTFRRCGAVRTYNLRGTGLRSLGPIRGAGGAPSVDS